MSPVASVAEFVAALRRCRLPEPPNGPQLFATVPDAATLSKELTRAGLLTQFQALYLLRGRGDDLVVGPFLLLDQLGAGGMGQVFLARHRLMDRVVALKFIHPDLLEHASAVTRFHQEVRAASRLSHSNIVQALHAEETPRGLVLAMEYCDGRDLGRVVREEGPLPTGRACEYAAQVAAGLTAAHAVGLVHRDIKPGNLLLSGGEQVKILDFGLALLPRSEDRSRITEAGEMFGTPDFISPEQARSTSQVDIRADVYSLGCTLYFLLTGQVPYPGGPSWEKVHRHTTGTPTPVEALRPDVPNALAAVLRTMMARDPAARLQTPAEVEAALGPFRDPAATTIPNVVAVPRTEFAPPFVPSLVPLTLELPSTPDIPSQPSNNLKVATPAPVLLSLTDESPALTTSELRIRVNPERRVRTLPLYVRTIAALTLVLFGIGIVWSLVGRDKPQDAHVQTENKDVPNRKPDDGKQPVIVVPTPDGTWAATTGLERLPIFRIAFSPTNPHLLAVAHGVYRDEGGTAPGGLELWNVGEGRDDRRRVILAETATPSVFALAFSPDGLFLACGAACLDSQLPKATVTVIETQTWSVRKQFDCEGQGVFALAFASGSRYLVAGTRVRPPGTEERGAFEVWDGGDNWTGDVKRIARQDGFGGPVNGVCFVAGPTPRFVTSCWDRTIRVWTLRPDDASDPLTRAPDLPNQDEIVSPIIDTVASADSRHVAVVTNSGGAGPEVARQVAVWTLPARGEPTFRSATVRDAADFCSLAFLPDSVGVAAVDRTGRLHVWDLPGLKERPHDVKPLRAGQV